MAGNNRMIKSLNQAAILNILRIRGAASKGEIALATGLSLNAVGMITARLMRDGYIFVSGIGESCGGRRPELLSLKPDSYYSLGADIDTDEIRFALIDLTGRVISHSRLKMDCVANAGAVFDAIDREIEKNLSDRLLGVGLAVAGQVDAPGKTVKYAPNLKWRDVKIADNILSKVNVFIENESILSAIYEGWSGVCRNDRNFICINSKSGIGAGIFTDGRVYRGTNGSAGEVGHIIVDIDGPRCGCGSRGCLETYASAHRIARLLGLSSIDEAAALAEKGDKAALDAFKRSALYLGVAISGLVNTLNPQKIVLGKEFVKYGGFIIDEVRRIVRRKALSLPSDNVEILISSEGEMSSVLGAAVLPLKKLFAEID